MGYAIWPRHLDAILTDGPAVIEAAGFTITERTENGWTAAFNGQHDYEDRVATLECRVTIETWDGVSAIWARYHEKRNTSPPVSISLTPCLAAL
jgi:hypothetical protein